MQFSWTNSLLGVFTGVHGFNVVRWGNVFGVPTIEQAIMENGRGVIKNESTHKRELYVASYRRNKKEIKKHYPDYFKYTYDNWKGGKVLEEWCEVNLNTKLNVFRKKEAERIAKWCALINNIENTLIKQGKQVIAVSPKLEAKYEYMSIYVKESKESKESKENDFLKDVMNMNSDSVTVDGNGWKSVEHWCNQALLRYGDATNTSDSIYKKAEKWCVMNSITTS